MDTQTATCECSFEREQQYMGAKTSIEWTDASWNPIRGCSRVSPGCENCYAERVAARFSGPGKPFHGLAVMRPSGARWTRKVRMVPEHLADPLRWRKPRRVFVNSMSDLFHEGLTDEQIAVIFAVMALGRRHTFQVLTKRATRMRKWFERVYNDGDPFNYLWELAEDAGGLDLPGFFEGSPPCDMQWPLPNVWMGVSAEDQESADERIPELLRTPAAVRSVSYEPALGPVDFAPWLAPCPGGGDYAAHVGGCCEDHARLDWVIVGGESGHGARPFDIQWARSVVEQCKEADVACFVKQLGADPHDSMRSMVGGWEPGDPEPDTRVRLRSRKGGDWSEWPQDLRVRQFPDGSEQREAA